MSAISLRYQKYNLVPRAHVSFGQRQDMELLNNQFPDSKILGVPKKTKTTTTTARTTTNVDAKQKILVSIIKRKK